MSKWHKNLDIDKWSRFAWREQMLMVGNEINRAKNMLAADDVAEARTCHERALELVDISLQDKKWRRRLRALTRLRMLIAQNYLRPESESELFKLSDIDFLSIF